MFSIKFRLAEPREREPGRSSRGISRPLPNECTRLQVDEPTECGSQLAFIYFISCDRRQDHMDHWILRICRKKLLTALVVQCCWNKLTIFLTALGPKQTSVVAVVTIVALCSLDALLLAWQRPCFRWPQVPLQVPCEVRYTILVSFVILNLFIAVIFEGFEESRRPRNGQRINWQHSKCSNLSSLSFSFVSISDGLQVLCFVEAGAVNRWKPETLVCANGAEHLERSRQVPNLCVFGEDK